VTARASGTTFGSVSPGSVRLLPFTALVLGPLREHPGRGALALLAVALGVALGVAVHLVNAAAANEFALAARHLAGAADLVVRAPPSGFDETLYERIARLPEVEAANPALEMEVAVADRKQKLAILGFDPLRALQVQPALLPEQRRLVSELFDADAVLLSPAAAQWLALAPGGRLAIVVGSAPVTLEVIGLLPPGAYRQRIAVMDIATAQWRLGQLGRLNRIDIRLRPGADAAAFRETLSRLLPPGVEIGTPEAEAERRLGLSRAYRLNLDLLALVALFTGAFLVFSTQLLAILRRRAQLAVLRALGVTRAGVALALAGEGALIGALGSALGVALGYALARYAVAFAGADLGAGYFRGIVAEVRADLGVFARFFFLGVGFAVLGAAAPALEAARRPPALALRAGDEETGPGRRASAFLGAAALAAGAAALRLPPFQGLPLGGYVAIAFILLGSVLLMPRLADALLRLLPLPRSPAAALALAQLKATPRQAAVSVAAIVISTSLMASMLIMVTSFRASLESWLERMLPADLYLRAAGGDAAFLDRELQERIARVPQLARVEFARAQSVVLDPGRPPVTLIARAISSESAPERLWLRETAARPGTEEAPPAWVSEIAAELYRLRSGEPLRLPLAGREIPFTVAGVWRDYARQNGAIVIERALYVRLTGDESANEAALWLAPGVGPEAAADALRAALPEDSGIELVSAGEVRARSLAAFDRTFAITYALEFAAVLVGLFGVSASFGAQALARRREFGVLRHLGVERREVARMLGWEGALTAGLGAALGLAVGWVIGLVLIHVVNRQSFHWSMDLSAPWPALAALATLVVAAATLTAVASGRAAMDDDVVRSVREDW
jgi:putative ABC transport system permease protein